MSDDKKKKKVDSWFLSMEQPYEVDYFVNDILSEFPGITRAEVMAALEDCVERVKPSEGRKKIKACVASKLKPQRPIPPDRDDRPKHPNRTHA